MMIPDAGGLTISISDASKLLCAIFVGLGGMLVAVSKLLYSHIMRNLNSKFAALESSNSAVRAQHYNFTRAVFMLLKKLNPGKAEVIMEVMDTTFADTVAQDTGKKQNGNAMAAWPS